MFKPRSQVMYVGLNMVYGFKLYSGKGLCQVYCGLYKEPASSPSNTPSSVEYSGNAEDYAPPKMPDAP